MLGDPAALEVTSASTPEGRSTESTGAEAALIAAIAALRQFLRGRRIFARLISGAENRVDDEVGASQTTRVIPARPPPRWLTTIGRRGSRANMLAASAFSPSAGPSSRTSTTLPAACKRRAATKPIAAVVALCRRPR